MTKRNCQRVLSLASIFLCLYLIPRPAEGKCMGQWSLQSCMGGNGKRSGMEGYSRENMAGDSEFLKRLLSEENSPQGYAEDEGSELPANDPWAATVQDDDYTSQAPRKDVMYQLLHILGRLKKVVIEANSGYDCKYVDHYHETIKLQQSESKRHVKRHKRCLESKSISRPDVVRSIVMTLCWRDVLACSLLQQNRKQV